MNQIIFQNEKDEEYDDVIEVDEFSESRNNVKLGLFIIMFVTIIAIGSLKLFSLATNEDDNLNYEEEIANNVVYETGIFEENNVNGNVISNVIENDIGQQVQNEVSENTIQENENQVLKEVQQDPQSLAQINTKTRKTSSGKSYTSIGFINIPSLNIKYQILSKTSEELLKISVNKYWGCNPNEVGNMCILGHNYKDSRFFGKLPKIKKGAKIYITDLEGKKVTYKVYKTDVVEEDDMSCTSQKTNGKVEITLITCYYEPGHKHATKRFIVKARAE